MIQARLVLLSLLVACEPGGSKLDGGAAPLETQGADGDGDGFPASEDCNDGDPAINGGAVEVCDGVDNDCDGQIDEEVSDTYFTDADGDGFGDPTLGVEACEAPSGTVPNDSDCNDGDPQSHPSASERCDELDNDCDGEIDEDLVEVWYQDTDEDGFGDPAGELDDCDPPSGYAPNAEDCDDDEPASFPGNEEVCDELDNDCDGNVDEEVSQTYYADRDGDGFGVIGETLEACSEPVGWSLVPGDCEDGNDQIHPDAAEACNGTDDDCDGDIDEDSAVDASLWYADSDSDGFGDPATGTLACVAPSGFVADNSDCDDAALAINPAATEVCNGVDDDCDASVDDADGSLDRSTAADSWSDVDGDGYGDPATLLRSCTLPAGSVRNALDCVDSNRAIHPSASEICNATDDDCDGLADDADPSLDSSTGTTFYADADTDGYGNPSAAIQACMPPSGAVLNAADCDDTRLSVNPAASEVCNGRDDDCDLLTDDSDASLDRSTGSTWYLDGDTDGYGASAGSLRACVQPAGTVTNATDCNDAVGAINPGATEICNSLDDDCDAAVDAADSSLSGGLTLYRDSDSDGYGSPSSSIRACSATAGYVSSNTDCNDSSGAINPLAPEICNSVDDDCDSAIDDADAGRIGGSSWYRDVDGDGYGAGSATTACTRPSGRVSNATDCDDGLVGVNPGATEVCNALDDDCDGAYDEGFDADADGIPDCEEINYTVVIYGTGDDSWTGYIDGSTLGTWSGWSTVDSVTLTLNSGSHTFAAYAWDTGAAIAGFLSAVYINGTLTYYTGRDFRVADSVSSSAWNTVGFADSSWGTPSTCSASDVSYYWSNQPASLLGTGARWVWHTGCTGLGDSYYRLNFTLP